MSSPHAMQRAKRGEHMSVAKGVTTPEEIRKRIPDFASIEEEAEFWDTHDSTDYEHEFEPVEFTVSPTLTSTWMLSIRLDKAAFDAIRTIAKAKGMGTSTLARMWILEELARTRGGEAM